MRFLFRVSSTCPWIAVVPVAWGRVRGGWGSPGKGGGGKEGEREKGVFAARRSPRGRSGWAHRPPPSGAPGSAAAFARPPASPWRTRSTAAPGPPAAASAPRRRRREEPGRHRPPPSACAAAPPPPPFWGDGPGAASGPSLTHPPRAGCGQGRAARPIPSHPFLRSSPLSRGQPRRRAGDPCPAAPALLAGHSPGLPGFRSLPATCPPEASCPQSWRKFPWNQGNGRHILTSCEPGRFLCHKDGGSGPETCLLPWILTHLVAPWDPLNHSFSC